MEDVHVKSNRGFSWQMQHSARRRRLSPAIWTSK